MDRIEDFEQAREAAARLLEFLSRKGSRRRTKPDETVAESERIALVPPATNAGYALDIFSSVRRPMTAKEIEHEWQRRNLPVPRSGQLYDTVHSTLLHLARQGRLVRIARGTYALPSPAK